LDEVGFGNVNIEIKPQNRQLVRSWFPESGAEDYVASADIAACKAID
jgi:hypothetical protein